MHQEHLLADAVAMISFDFDVVDGFGVILGGEGFDCGRAVERLDVFAIVQVGGGNPGAAVGGPFGLVWPAAGRGGALVPCRPPASTGVGRSDGRLAGERFVQRWNERPSLRPVDYADVTRNASYYIPLALAAQEASAR